MRVRILGPSSITPGQHLYANIIKPPDKAQEEFGLTDVRNRVTVTTYTPEELRLTAAWPLIWLQAPGSIEILRKLFPGEIVPSVTTI